MFAMACATSAGARASADTALDSLAEQRVALQVSYNPNAANNLGVPAPDHRRWADRSQPAIAAFQHQSDRPTLEALRSALAE